MKRILILFASMTVVFGSLVLPQRSARAVSTRFAAVVLFDGIVREDIWVTLTSGSSHWTNTDFHMDGHSGLPSYVVYEHTKDPTFTGPGEGYDDYYMPSVNGADKAPTGSYDCWAVAHGETIERGVYTYWDAGVTSVTVDVP